MTHYSVAHSPAPTDRRAWRARCLRYQTVLNHMKILNYLMTACFLFSVIVQYNDPDPLLWMLIYGCAGAACVLAILNRGNWIFPAAIGLAALVWALTLAPQVIGKVAFGEL